MDSTHIETHNRPITPKNNLWENLGKQKRKLRTAIEEVFIDNPDQQIDYPKIITNLTTKGVTKYDRVVSAMRLINQLIPQKLQNVIRKSYGYTQESMPLNPNDFILKEKIGFGGVNNVYLLASQKENQKSYVLKVSHLSDEAESTNDVLELAKEQMREYETISSAYQDIKGLIPAEYYLVLHGPRNSKPVAALIQPYIGTNIRDIFTDFEPDELKYLMEKNSGLAAQVKQFVDITNSNTQLLDNELDLLGEDNLAVVGKAGEERLLMLDPHFRSKPYRNPDMKKEITRRLNYLSELSDTVQEGSKK